MPDTIDDLATKTGDSDAEACAKLAGSPAPHAGSDDAAMHGEPRSSAVTRVRRTGTIHLKH
jgi:hypothetical protein